MIDTPLKTEYVPCCRKPVCCYCRGHGGYHKLLGILPPAPNQGASMTIFAYTPSFPMQPEYINVSAQENGSTIVTVRSQGEQFTSKINLPPAELEKLGWALIDRAEKLMNPANLVPPPG